MGQLGERVSGQGFCYRPSNHAVGTGTAASLPCGHRATAATVLGNVWFRARSRPVLGAPHIVLPEGCCP